MCSVTTAAYFFEIKEIHQTLSSTKGVGSVHCLFGLTLYVPSTIFQLCRDGSSWVEPVLS